MYPLICESLYNKNTLIVGERNCGKTTFLKQIVNDALSRNYKLIVFDSATEHIEKSILVYCKKLFNDWLEIKSPEKELIDCGGFIEPFPFGILKENISHQIYLFDVSRYLEEGFEYEAENPMREITRLLYKKLVLQCLAVIYEFVNHGKYIVIMDEIEFAPGFAKIIEKFNKKDIFFIDCIHKEDSCDCDIRRMFDMCKQNIIFPYKSGVICDKDENMLCGPACLHYYLNLVKGKNKDIPNNLIWIADLAKFLFDIGIEHELSCFESSLYTDFINGSIPHGHPAELSIKNYLSVKKDIIQRQFSLNDILYNKLPDTYFIASVRSVFLDNTSPEGSFHYVLAHQSMDKIAIICPRKTYFVYLTMEKEDIVKMINDSGNWIIKIP